ncbi:DUF5682 family protein [Methylocystis heyeri]|uniref:ChaN family lipoprotein n=1 Tax=Methylocystis heyeri TaxID=391905 RepID=A0A6B8KFM8_9HYPH|nr:DUF5682 family protein [Methylocystis heyeri]QGM46402.1 hypothetical protein H2LOC_012240 [Methylocystis heyeri]
MAPLLLLGVRHHSPACARHVEATIRAHRPAYVLIEGPADFNPHIEDLRLDHTPPIAIFSYCADETTSRSSYSPFCAYSPEWRALRTAFEIGATPLFCDLPAWHPDFGERANRYADPHPLLARRHAADAALQVNLRAEGSDAAWDALIEQAEEARLPKLLETYFELLRPDGAEDAREAGREKFMAAHVAWALKEAAGRPVALVCGGWHVGGVRRFLGEADGARPICPQPPEGARAESYLTPYSFARLDAFSGYAAGMPSPGYWNVAYQSGLEAAADWAMTRIGAALRDKGLPVSTADRIAWRAHACALANLRGHRAILRADLLDAALSALVKDGLSGPAAWTRSGAVTGAADDIVVEMLFALCDDKEGRLASGVRLPPLIQDLERRLAQYQLTPDRVKKLVAIDWRDKTRRGKAHTLHQMRLLELPGVLRIAGPPHADARDLTETFEIAKHSDWMAAVIEASRWGGDLPMAATARLRARLDDAPGNVDTLAAALSDGLFAGLYEAASSTVELEKHAAACREIGPLGRAARRVTRLYRFGDVFGATRALAPLAQTMFERILFLLEGPVGDGRPSIDAVIAARDFARGCDGLALSLSAAREVFERIVANAETPPALAGAALGWLVAMGFGDAGDGAAARIKSCARPENLGDFLGGLFALAREEIGTAAPALVAVDGLVAGWTQQEFLAALPAMRGAFAWFPPREREALARVILQLSGREAADAEAIALDWMRQRKSVESQAQAMDAEARALERLARWGFN